MFFENTLGQEHSDTFTNITDISVTKYEECRMPIESPQEMFDNEQHINQITNSHKFFVQFMVTD